jgi:RND family efflux transporter MFP subunit
MKRHIWSCLALVILTACSGTDSNNKEKEGVETVLPQQVNEVTVMKLAKGNFNHELVSNGKIVAKEYADLYFRTSEVVAKVYVKNGMYVRKGQKLAELDLFKLNNTLTQNKNALAQANLEMQDVLIGQGYAPDNLSAVPAEKLELAKVKSGYERAKAQYEASLYDVEQATLIAPFDGVVANLFDKQYNMSKSGEPFCRIIRTSAMEVDFTVLESELPLIKVGDQVEVTPYATAVGTRTGNVSEINPLVDENGMVRVKAQVNGGEKLFDGMNVRISVKRSVPDQMVVPRTAIVLRAGKQVIFTVKDSIAMWNYVQTGLENLSEYTLVNWEASGLQEGMTVITTGNVNLAHETPVKIIEK